MPDRPTHSFDPAMRRSCLACWLPRRPNCPPLRQLTVYQSSPWSTAYRGLLECVSIRRARPCDRTGRDGLPASGSLLQPLRHLTVLHGSRRGLPPIKVRAQLLPSSPTAICRRPDPACWSPGSVARTFPPAHGLAGAMYPARPPAAFAPQYLLARPGRSCDRVRLASIPACAFPLAHGSSGLAPRLPACQVFPKHWAARLSWSLARPSQACWPPRRGVAAWAFPPAHGSSGLAPRLPACRVSLRGLLGSRWPSARAWGPQLAGFLSEVAPAFRPVHGGVTHRPPSLSCYSSTRERCHFLDLLSILNRSSFTQTSALQLCSPEGLDEPDCDSIK
jgi:hypothetical protein